MKKCRVRADVYPMSRFVTDAEQLLAAASAASAEPACDTVVAFDRYDAIRVLDGAGWQLPALSAELGAARIYRVTRDARKVRVEGRNGSMLCTLEIDRGMRPAPPRATPEALRHAHDPISSSLVLREAAHSRRY